MLDVRGLVHVKAGINKKRAFPPVIFALFFFAKGVDAKFSSTHLERRLQPVLGRECRIGRFIQGLHACG
jgi:hypothetical protein